MAQQGGSQQGCFVEISNISSLLDTKTLRELFECCGQIKRIDMRRSMKGRICIVQFSNENEMEAAAMLSGTQLGDLALYVKKMTFERVREMMAETEKQEEGCPDVSTMDEVEKARKQVEAWAEAPVVTASGDNQFLTEADKRREEQIRRTIYVGNLHPQIMEDHIKAFFSTQGEILYVKMSAPGLDQRYAFVEFIDEASALRSFALSGTVLGDRPVKIGKTTTPISKNVGTPSNILANPVRLSNAMSHVRCALDMLNKRKGHVPKKIDPLEQKNENESRNNVDSKPRSKSRKRSRSKSRKKKRRRRRSRSSSRSRSRSRKRRRRRRRRSYSRSRSRSYDKIRSSKMWKRGMGGGGGGGGAGRGKQDMVWDGFQWHPKDSTEGKATKAAARAGMRGPAGYPNAEVAQTATATMGWQANLATASESGGLGAQLAAQALKTLGAPPGI